MALALLGSLMPLHSEVAIVESPHTSLSKTRKLLDAIDLRVMLNLDFQHAVDLGERGELRHRHGVIESRLYARDQRGRVTWVEVAIIAGVGEGYELALYNPDGEGPSTRVFDDMVERTKQLVGREKSYGSTTPDVGYEMFQLGYIESDRALSLLKALGYNTIEFSLKSKNSNYSTPPVHLGATQLVLALNTTTRKSSKRLLKASPPPWKSEPVFRVSTRASPTEKSRGKSPPLHKHAKRGLPRQHWVQPSAVPFMVLKRHASNKGDTKYARL